MNYMDACKYLNISLNTHFKDKLTLKYIKRKYYSQALLHHPDKNNNTPESIKRFKKINESYVWLSNNVHNINYNTLYEPNRTHSSSTSIYKIIEKLYERLNANIVISIATTLIHAILITTALKEKYLKIINNMDESTCLYIYETFVAYQYSTNSELPELADWIKDITAIKCNRLEIITLSPPVSDLFDANLIQFNKYDTTFIIPTWFPVSSFTLDINCNLKNKSPTKYTKEIRFICRPQLPPNITIADDTNDIIVNLFNDNIHKCEQIIIGKQKFEISLSELDQQTLKSNCYIGYNLLNVGVPCLNYLIDDDEYDNINKTPIKRANIIIYIHLNLKK